MRFIRTAIAVLTVSASSAPGGGLHNGDIALFVEGGTIRTGALVRENIVPNRVFAAELALDGGKAFTDEPGILCAPGTFAPFSVIGLDYVDALREWQGGSFETLSTAWIEIEFGQSVTRSPATAGTTAQGPLMAVSQSGDLHNHPLHYLVGSESSGLYLLAFRATNTGAAGPSEPFYLIYNLGRPSEEEGAAIAWVTSNLLSPVCPADLTGDGLVNSADLAAQLGAWGVGGGPADLSGDGIVNSVDLAQMLGAWGACP